MRERYAKLWWFARTRGVYEPLAILFMSLWLSYSTWDTARHHLMEAAVLGALLGASFLLALFLMLMGLIAGGRWREMPRALSWSLVQKLEMVSEANNAEGRFELCISWVTIIIRYFAFGPVTLVLLGKLRSSKWW